MNDAKVLIVEGGDDEKVIIELTNRRKIQRNFDINISKGIPNIFNVFETAIDFRQFKTIGIIVDADTDLKVRWQEIKSILESKNYKNIPKQPNVKGTIILQDKMPTIGIWLMPNNQITGSLETFVKFLIPNSQKDILFTKAESIVNQLITNEENKFTPDHKDKATLHTWLAWQKKPGLSLGQAISERYRELLDDKRADDFLDWLKKLFKD